MKTEKSNVEKFYEWMQRINSIHLANAPAMAAAFQKNSNTKNSNTKIMKTRVKEEQFKQVKIADLIGILWKSGEKGILIVTKEGVISMNNDNTDLTLAVLLDSKSQFLGAKDVKRGTKKVFKFENMSSLLKWFAKK